MVKKEQSGSLRELWITKIVPAARPRWVDRSARRGCSAAGASGINGIVSVCDSG